MNRDSLILIALSIVCIPTDLGLLLPHLRAMFANTNEDATLQRHIVSALTTMLPPVVKHMKDFPTKENKTAWDALMACVDADVVPAAQGGRLDAAASQAVHKLLEVLVTLASDSKVRRVPCSS